MGTDRHRIDLQGKMNSYTCSKKRQKRYDQSLKPSYPSFTLKGCNNLLGGVGWGSDKKELKYKHVHPLQG
jgi:hypothetical protein